MKLTYFGIRGKVALLVILATAASALLVAKVLTSRATVVLREHELVDLGDEASLRGWELMDQIEGLREDLINVAFSPTFAEDVAAEKTQEELLSMARGLCRRNWEKHLRVDLIEFAGGERNITVVAEKGKFKEDDLWFPGPDARAGARLHLSPIQRLHVTRTDLPDHDALDRYEPIVWAVAPLDRGPGSTAALSPTFIRIGMTLHDEPSPRHLFVLETPEGTQLVRHDESDPLERGNDAVFLALADHPELLRALEERAEEEQTPDQDLPKVDRLTSIEYVDLVAPYYFQEGIPNPEMSDAFASKSDEEMDAFLENLQIQIGKLGRVGGLQSRVKEFRMLARSKEDLAQLQEIVTTALQRDFSDAFREIKWRNVVECDQIHSWFVKLRIGNGESARDYRLQYAVFDDELASSIEYEMLTVQNVAFLVAGAFGIIGFFMAMHFIHPLKQMTETAQTITSTHQDDLYTQVAGLAARMESKRRDEIGDISRASKVLFEELVAMHEQLEQRVSERTRELRRANAELENANDKLMSLSHEKDAFVAKVSHDLRQPLNAIFLQVEALKLSDLDEGQKKDVERIHAHAARELNLVNDILEYQKIIMGAETLNRDEINVPALLDDIATTHSAALRDKEVTFEHHCDEALETLVADDRRVRQVLGNLVGNACKFTKEGRVTLEARPRDISEKPWIEFTVTDTGRGMSPEEQSKAFVPFVSNKKDNAGGSGLGLSICKELVGQLGGKIGFVSELGKGTHFSVFLPLEPDSEFYDANRDGNLIPEPVIDPEKKAIIDARDATVLVIDDDAKVRELLSRMLQSEGYRVITAVDGNEGLEMANLHKPDAITLDVVMPGGKDGWEVLRELKDSPDTQSIPVIMVSVMAEQEHGLALDVEDYLVKPIDVDRLSRVILRVTGQSPQRNLLLIDDDRDSLEAMGRILEDAGWHTLLAGDGAEGLEILSKTRPAAIILDLVMPGMDGFEFLEHLEEDEHLRSIPVIVLSGKDPSEAERDFLNERVGVVLKKGRHSAGDLVQNINARLLRG
ncbi:MAG: response regulator [Verrucomicrobiales bacterium]|nr:response regulator [Verrucomicrobiales bacterium]